MTDQELEQLKKDAARYRYLRDVKSFSFHLELNPHKTTHRTVEQWLEDHGEGDPDIEFLDIVPGEREKMVAAQSFWMVQDYYRTSVGFTTLGAASLDALIDGLLDE